MRKRKHRNSFSSASAHNPKSPDKVELLFSFEISFSLVRLACTAHPEVENLPLKPKDSCRVSPAYVYSPFEALILRTRRLSYSFLICNWLSISQLVKSLKSPLLLVTRKGRSLDKTPIVLVSSLIPTLPVELLQVLSSYRRYLVYQLSYLLKR